jgi:hypothetical protein
MKPLQEKLFRMMILRAFNDNKLKFDKIEFDRSKPYFLTAEEELMEVIKKYEEERKSINAD